MLDKYEKKKDEEQKERSNKLQKFFSRQKEVGIDPRIIRYSLLNLFL